MHLHLYNKTNEDLIDSKLANLEKGLPQENAAPLLDKLVFDKVSHPILRHSFLEIAVLHSNEVLLVADETSTRGTSSYTVVWCCTFA